VRHSGAPHLPLYNHSLLCHLGETDPSRLVLWCDRRSLSQILPWTEFRLTGFRPRNHVTVIMPKTCNESDNTRTIHYCGPQQRVIPGG
jgi:hypothetical protein